MNNGYRSQLENDAIKRRLLNQENLPILEDLLDKSTQQFMHLQGLEMAGKLNLGNEIAVDELDDLASKVYSEVDDLLGFNSSEKPKISFDPRYSSRYTETDGQKFITIATLQIPKLVPITAHEYAHFVQYRNGLGDFCYNIVTEGNARCVERHVAEAHREKEDSESFLYDILEKDVNEFRDVYWELCKRFNKKPKDSLLKINSILCQDGDEVHYTPDVHSLGNAFFSICKAHYGKDLCKQMIHGDFKFTKWYQFSSWLNVCNRMRTT